MLNQSKFPKNIFLGGKQIFQVEFSKTINQCFFMRPNTFIVKSLKFLWAIEMQYKLVSRYPDFCAHTLHYTVCQFIIIEALLSAFEGKGLWGQTWPPNLLCPFSRYMSVRPVQYWSWIRSADLQISNVVLRWLDGWVFEQRFMVFENYLKSALLLWFIIGIWNCSRFLHFIEIW